jgi:hypothetical protein
VKSGADSPVEGDDDGDDNVPESYRRKSLSPETPSSTSYLHPEKEKSDTRQLSPIASMELASS